MTVPDQETFKTLGREDSGKMFIKVVLLDTDTDRPSIYFINVKTHTAHNPFLDAAGIDRSQLALGEGLVYGTIESDLDGRPGGYYFWIRPSNTYYSVARMEYFYTLLAASMPLLDDNLAVYMGNSQLRFLQPNLALYSESRIPLVFDKDIYPETSFLALNPGEGYGLLRVMEPKERPNPRDIVIYEALPNELPRVAGVISTVPQTPLTHVNLRAVQDRIPNAFIREALDQPAIASLLDSYVHYTVTKNGYTIQAATKTAVDNHYASSRPTLPQTPQRDLSVTSITPLSEIGFEDWEAFGVKAANVAVLGTLGFPAGTVPDGYAIPFYFYDEFMKHNDFYTRIQSMLDDADFQDDYDTQEDKLKKLRKAIENAETPEWILTALADMNRGFTDGINRRYRSSTNNEDLPGFNGAGLYDSKSQKPSEDEEDLAKSLKEVYASLWTFRAFIERDFHRVDHLKTAMGILVHPSYQDELANGVAVSIDPTTRKPDDYYVNTQLGEDLVTNPEAHSVPEEIMLHPNRYTVLASSNQVEPGRLLMSDAQLTQLREHLITIHDHFERLYNPGPNEPFAMEIEFKITSDNVLAIKQARPWVFSDAPTRPPPPIIIITTGTRGGGGGPSGPSGPTPSEVDFEWNVTRDIEELDGGNDRATGVWSDGTTLWVADNADGAGDAVYAYDLASGERVEEREFELDERNRAPRGVWSDGETVWVSDSGRERLFAYRLADGERVEEREFALAAGNSDARGIWSDEETMWVLDGVKDSLFAYDLESGALLAEYELDAANDDPRGVWSDGVTVWVSDHGAKRLFAYRVPVLPDAETDPGEEDADDDARELERVRDEEFSMLSRASNNSPRGIWSDGDVMYVADESDDRVYSYNMPDAADARLASLTLSGVDIGEFDPRRPDYEAVVADGVTETTVEAEAMQRRTDVAIDPPDADGDDANGHQIALAGLAEVIVTVTSQDGSRSKTYRVRFPETGWDPGRDPWPHCLRGAVSEGFSLVVHEGGSVEELIGCAESRGIVALYALHEGVYVSHILGAPDFVNAGFLELFPDGLPPITPLVAASNGPPSADPFGDLDDGGQQPWPQCLRGAVAAGFSLVVYEGGSVDELEACARNMDITSLYTLSEGEFVSYILGAPDFVTQPFRDLFADGLPLMTPLVARSEGPPGDR